MVNVAILGASGFVGGELLRLCAGHPELQPTHLFGESRAGSSVAEVHPHLALAYSDRVIERFGAHLPDGVDLVLAALPHGHSQTIARDIMRRGIPFVDLGADFRLSGAQEYARWYGEPHRAPDLISRFVYGIPELNRSSIATARSVAAAGCYPTAAILALKPLIDAGLIVKDSVIVDAASGVSGAGRGPKESTAFSSVAESFSAYGLLTHRHTAEMQENLGTELIFTPHLAPMNRGILATCYGQAAYPMADGEPEGVLRAAYADEPFIHVSREPPSTKWTLGSNMVQIAARYDPRTKRVVVICALDNLVKGASGQMIQCANLMLGLDETRGLPVCGVYP
jgi:N-acetyl-gamma-glutamyl-phosphate reductase